MLYRNPAIATTIALSLGLGLAACGGATTTMANRSLNSVNQPVVETRTYVLDLSTVGNGGLAATEQRRLADWFKVMEVGFGDRIAIDGLQPSEALRADVAGIASRHGLLLSDAAPVTAGAIPPRLVRVTVTRSSAHVPGCPQWGDRPGSATSANYGCAINGNLAAMVADPRDLLEGAKAPSNTVAMTSNKAIATYREQPTTGTGRLAQLGTSEE